MKTCREVVDTKKKRLPVVDSERLPDGILDDLEERTLVFIDQGPPNKRKMGEKDVDVEAEAETEVGSSGFAVILSGRGNGVKSCLRLHIKHEGFKGRPSLIKTLQRTLT